MRLPDQLLECVAFLCVEDGRGAGYRYGGTAFFISVPAVAVENASARYLVTARHCVRRAEAHGPLFVRVNRRDGGAEFMRLDGEWLYPENEAVDLALFGPWAPTPDTYRFRVIPREMFASPENLARDNVGIGDDLAVVGLFTERTGRESNLPIVRSGIIASVPSEALIDDDTGLEYHAYLAEVRSIGGLSGSPVFAALGPVRMHEDRLVMVERYHLLGLIRGHWDTARERGAVEFTPGDLEQVNMGMAIVTPVSDLTALMDREDVVRERRRAERQFIERRDRAAGAPPADDGGVGPQDR